MSVSYPLSVPDSDGSKISVDLMLKEPTRITRYLSDLTLQNFFVDRIFTTQGGISGGALLYTQLTRNDLYTDRDVQNVEPGAEFPVVTVGKQAAKVAAVEKFGGKFFVTDEARDRNDPTSIQNESRKLANTVQRGINRRAISALNASVAAVGPEGTVASVSWSDAATLAGSGAAPALMPAKTFADLKAKAETAELGVEFNLMVLNPQDMVAFQTVYGQNWSEVAATWGIELIASNQVAAGSAYAVAEGMVGVLGIEKPMTTETWREEATERTWVQTSVRPVFAVTDPYAVVKVTGLGA